MGLPPEVQEKWDKLDKKLKDVREREEAEKKNTNQKTEEQIQAEKRSARASSAFLSNIIAGGLLGYGIDWLFDTTPWGMMGFLILGFVSATIRASAALKKSNEENQK
ncbi:MAG: hypothetical protein GC137_10090 [Alphaproteobacteria bacterium]|nr:hypothetical protein [Alphaproteobacteria bacterium]